MTSPCLRGSLAAVGMIAAFMLSAGPGAAQAPFEITTNMKASADLASRLPSDIKARGVLNGATTDGNAPWSFIDQTTGKPAGVDADLINEAAKRLGLTVNWSDVQFTAGIPGVQSGRFDFYVSAMADTLAREKVVDFIAYSKEGSGVIVPKGNPQNIAKMEDLCGKRVAIVTGSLFPDIVKKLNESCPSPVVLSETADQTGPYLAVASGQADATMNTYGVSNYTLKTATEGIQTKLELSPVALFAPANQGIAFSKKTPDLLAALAGAMQAMVEDGTYKQIMDKWQVGDGGLNPILINAALF
jgi:polar amino acid transport system substrate-binding protein